MAEPSQTELPEKIHLLPEQLPAPQVKTVLKHLETLGVDTESVRKSIAAGELFNGPIGVKACIGTAMRQQIIAQNTIELIGSFVEKKRGAKRVNVRELTDLARALGYMMGKAKDGQKLILMQVPRAGQHQPSPEAVKPRVMGPPPGVNIVINTKADEKATINIDGQKALANGDAAALPSAP